MNIIKNFLKKDHRNNILYIIIDSARYDAAIKASTPNMDNFGTWERRWSFSSWTFPSHHVYMMGMTPHKSPSNVYASEVYKEDFVKWIDRSGVDDVSFKNFVPHLNLNTFLKKYDYETHAMVSMPVLNPKTNFNTEFDSCELMSNHNDFAGIIEKLEFPKDKPQFYMLNLGEAHYPYRLHGEPDVPILHGVHGVFKHLDDFVKDGNIDPSKSEEEFLDMEQMKRLQNNQVECIEYIDGLMADLFNKCPKNTWIIITSDHGELFGEEGYFGHGPIFHEKVFEIPFMEGRI